MSREAGNLKRWRAEQDNERIPVVMRSGDTPVLIPNTMVKTRPADDTMLETAWESRWPPDFKKEKTGFTSDQEDERIHVSDD